MKQGIFDPAERRLDSREQARVPEEIDYSAFGILVLACLWLIFLIYPCVGLLQRRLWSLPFVLAFAGTLVFFICYFWVVWGVAFRTLGGVPWRVLFVMGTLGLVLPCVGGETWLGLFTYTALIAGFTLRLRQMIAVVLLMEGVTALMAAITHAPWWETVALATVILVGSCTAFGISWLRAIIQELHTARPQIATMAASEERLWLARELHDSVKQQVFVTSMELGAAQALLDHDRHSAEMHLHEAETAIRQVHTDLDALIHELRPASFEEQNLGHAIKAHTAIWSRRTHIAATVRVQGRLPAPRETTRALFRVAQEALTNVEKHSAATQVQVILTWTDQLLQVQIRDNGRGFVPGETAGRGYGLLHMRERMEVLGGTLSIESTPGSGTCIRCSCPTHSPGKETYDA